MSPLVCTTKCVRKSSNDFRWKIQSGACIQGRGTVDGHNCATKRFTFTAGWFTRHVTRQDRNDELVSLKRPGSWHDTRNANRGNLSTLQRKITSTTYNIHTSHKHLQRVTIIYILTLAQFAEIRIERYHRVCSTEIQRVVDTPVDLETRESGERWRWESTIGADVPRGLYVRDEIGLGVYS